MGKRYNFLIVGAGLFGSTFAREATKRGKSCLVIDRRDHIGGNIYTDNIEGINIHRYGAHIFHTDSDKVWSYVNNFVQFNRFTNSPIANYRGKLYNLPFNMNTFYQLWGVTTPDEAKAKIREQCSKYSHIDTPQNLEEQALVLGGDDIYNTLIKGYTEKQWGRLAVDLPPFIIRRIPFRFTFDNNYFNDKYQGVPIGGYNRLIEGLLEGVEVQLGVDFNKSRDELEALADKVLYTGKIDSYFNYSLGELEYRSLHFETEVLNSSDYQGNAVVNYTDRDVPFTRVIEHNHFEFEERDRSVITREYPHEFSRDNEPYYPLNDAKNMNLLKRYKELAQSKSNNLLLGGRLAEYKYYDMDDTIESALDMVERVFS